MHVRLRMSLIDKAFSGVKALSGVDLELHAGEVHALLGANGAGKSTLMKIVAGALPSDSGTMEMDGVPVRFSRPKDALDAGIFCVYQEVDTALVSTLTVAENVGLHTMAHGGPAWISPAKLAAKAREALLRLDASIDPKRLVSQLTIAEKQHVLLARALTYDAKVIVFDEPTAPLSVEDAQRLFRTIRQLKEDGVAIVFVSHRLPEVFEISDSITVLRDGVRVWTKRASETDTDDVVEAMLGKRFAEEYPKRSVPIGDRLLEVEGLSRGAQVRNVQFHVSRGEIVGVAGLVGAGKTELARLLFGADKAESGTIKLNGKRLSLRTPADAVQAGIALVPEERRREGLLLHESVALNLTLSAMKRFTWYGWLNGRKEAAHADSVVNALGIKTPSISTPTAALSGGNQQKTVIGRWFAGDISLYLFDEPTKGVDIGAKRDIFERIGDLAAKGNGIVYLSAELDELVGIADRIYIMHDGRLVKEVAREEASASSLLRWASGVLEDERL